MKTYVNEPRVLLALLILAVIPLTYWTFDRREPVEQLINEIEAPVRPGDSALVRSKVVRYRGCYTRFERYLFDGEGVRYAMDVMEFMRVGDNAVDGKPDEFRQRIPVPPSARPGRGSIRFVVSWSCNPVQTVWPVTRIINMPLEIIP